MTGSKLKTRKINRVHKRRCWLWDFLCAWILQSFLPVSSILCVFFILHTISRWVSALSQHYAAKYPPLLIAKQALTLIARPPAETRSAELLLFSFPSSHPRLVFPVFVCLSVSLSLSLSLSLRSGWLSQFASLPSPLSIRWADWARGTRYTHTHFFNHSDHSGRECEWWWEWEKKTRL